MSDWNTTIIEQFRAQGGKGVAQFGDALLLLHNTGARTGEIGHVRFGGGTSEKGLITGTSLASYPTARRVRAGGRWKRT